MAEQKQQVDYKMLLAREYKRCCEDPAYFMRKYVYIQHPMRGRILFDLYPFQEKVLHLFRDSQNIITLKSRQLGISTLAAGYSLWLMIFHKDKNVLCLATTQATARNLVKKVIFAYEQLPKWMQVPYKSKNKLSMELRNGSKIEAKSSNSDAARSEAVSLLLVDEAAFIDNIEETFAAAQMTLATGGQAMLLSTPNGMGNFFHKTWVKAELGENSFTPVRLPWQVHPERDQSWRDKQDADLGPRLAAQECIAGESTVTIQYSDKDVLKECQVTIEELYWNCLSINYSCPQGIKAIDLKILTPDGFEYFDGIKQSVRDYYYRGTFTNGSILRASADHKIYTEAGPKEMQYLTLEDRVLTPDGYTTLVSLERVGEQIKLYDAVNAGQKHRFYACNLLISNCDCDFLTSGNGVFEPEDLKYYEDNFCKDPIERRGLDNNLWIWEYPDYSRSYMVSADVARGDGSDYSAFHVWDVEACAQVAEYKGQLTPRDFGATLCGIAAEYNNALLVVENANVGWSTIEEIMARGYPNLYYSTVGSGRNETAESYMRKMETGKTVPGFTTSPATRPLVISKLYDFIHQQAVILRSKRLIEEMRVFIWSKSGKAEAANGYHDDLVLSCGIGIYTRDTALRNKSLGVDATRAALGGFINLNQRSPQAETRPTFVQNPYQIQNPYGQNEDITWLLR